jgi:tRNA pseudouridine38-40 synthase
MSTDAKTPEIMSSHSATNNTDEKDEPASSNKRPIDDDDAATATVTATTTDESPSDNNNNNNNNKRAKKEATAKNTIPKQQRGYNVKVDERNRTPHEGSYANPAMKELLGIDLDNLEDRIIIDESTQKLVKRKIALFLGFLGTNYVGFQINLNQRTLQAEVEFALFKAGLLNPLNFGHPHKYSWSNSARTDKGVHACAQVCSVKVELLAETDVENLEGVRQRIEARLPSDIRVLDLVRTTRNFCAKTSRDRVRYQYMIPSFMLHPDYRGILQEQGIPLEGRQEVANAPLSKEEIQKLQTVLKGYRSTEEQRASLQTALAKYEGTHPFHNFTKGIKAGQPQAKRYIESFRVQDPVIHDGDGVEWIPTQILGQSFLLHQIRKMVSMAIDVARGTASLPVLDAALMKTNTMRVSLAPAQGLFLEMSYFGGYNRHKNNNNNDLPNLDWTKEGPPKDRWEAMRTRIRQHIVDEEEKQGNFIQYLYQQECIFEHERFYRVDGNQDESLESENKKGSTTTSPNDRY